MRPAGSWHFPACADARHWAFPRTPSSSFRSTRTAWFRGFPDVYAAGDVTASSIKQGGIATQQADAVASAIAARFGAPVEPKEFRPILRGMLLTGDGARFMRAEVTGGGGERSEVSAEVLWWPEGKIAGRHLSPYLARQAHAVEPEPPLTADAIPVDVDLAQGAGLSEASLSSTTARAPAQPSKSARALDRLAVRHQHVVERQREQGRGGPGARAPRARASAHTRSSPPGAVMPSAKTSARCSGR